MQSSESFSNPGADLSELLPPYLAAAGAEPLLFEQLRWQEQTMSDASLLPAPFRARLFTLLTYERHVPYCLHYLLVQLLSQNQRAADIAALLQEPANDEERAALLALLASQAEPLQSWPEPTSPLERALLWAAGALLLPGEQTEQARLELRRLLPSRVYASLQAFLAFVQTCHLWITAYPERAHGADEQARQYLLRLLQRYELEEQACLRSLLERLGSCTDEAIFRHELELYRRRLRAVLEAIGDSVLLYDHRGRLVYVNAVARRLLPLLQPDHARRAALAEAGERAQGEALEGREAAEVLLLADTPTAAPLQRILREGYAIAGEQAVDIKVKQVGGEEAIFSFSGAPVRSSRGQVIGAIIIGREVTARRRLEQRAHTALSALLAMAEALVQVDDGEPPPLQEGQSEGQTRLIMLRLGELTRQVLGCRRVAMLGLERETERVQHVAVTGVTPQQERLWQEIVLGTPLSAFLSAALLERLRAGESLLIDLEAPEFSHLRRQVRSYSVRALLIIPMCLRERLIGLFSVDYGPEEHSYSPDELALAAAVARMATLVLEREHLLAERAEARASALALREANRRMDEFISFASHELRAPLTVLKANAQLIKRLLQKASALGRDLGSGSSGESNGGQPALQAHPVLQRLASIPELLDRSIAQVDLLDRLVGDLLDFSRIQSETLQLVRRRLDLAAIVRDVVQSQQQVHPGRDIRLSIESSGEVPVEVDAARIGQVLTNYLLNAIRYAPPDRPIEVRLRIEGERARVLVRDEGPGVPPELQQRIWERFYRAPGIPVQEGSPVGLGLGLHICRTIIRLHGGEVGLESQPGQGATFWFALPLVQPQAAEKPAG
ncbi:sensor histidine kinase [Thermogemmatispora onikobensis]|uniref:sensor histidine kinase n=1 Tax=Thermogemmatispora onikobensis TaxID=732234 RepID=UPI000853DD2A|nr:PAS domain-containing sensor histidine kinase [Thermogemmatispora onikobensis]